MLPTSHKNSLLGGEQFFVFVGKRGATLLTSQPYLTSQLVSKQKLTFD